MQASSKNTNKHQKLPLDKKLFLLAISSLLPVLTLAVMMFIANAGLSTVQLIIIGFCLFWVVTVAYSVKNQFIYQIRTLNTLVEAINAEDYSLRSNHLHQTGDLAELYQQINSLTAHLQKSRQDEQEISTLLERIINQINVAIIVCDNVDQIVLVNYLAAKLLDQSEKALLGLPLAKTPLAEILPNNSTHLIDFDFPGARGRWQISQQSYVQDGRRGSLIFITDLEQVLSEEEIKAWQSLIRVIAHEVNNSLTPITSLCQTLSTLLTRELNYNSIENLQEGLEVINERAVNLKSFISDYARIARLPEANKISFNLKTLIEKIKTIYSDQVTLHDPDMTDLDVFGDPAQIEQILINLVKNALEANVESKLPITIKIVISSQYYEIMIIDNGVGISNPANLFVPFYTTKPKGAGIGLTLCRRIAAAHNGEVTLVNRTDKGAVATLKLPLKPL